MELVKVNIRPRFDFDSDAPVKGIVVDEAKEKVKAEWWHSAIHLLLAINVALLGFWLIGWWTIHFHLMTRFMLTYAPSLMQMVMTGW